MATDAEELAAIKTLAIARLKELLASPKPSYNVDGQSFSWNEYQRMLVEQIKSIDEILGADEPFEIHTQGYT